MSRLNLDHNLLDGLGPLGFIWLQMYLFPIYRYVKYESDTCPTPYRCTEIEVKFHTFFTLALESG
jgi:hypothetical protein